MTELCQLNTPFKKKMKEKKTLYIAGFLWRKPRQHWQKAKCETSTTQLMLTWQCGGQSPKHVYPQNMYKISHGSMATHIKIVPDDLTTGISETLARRKKSWSLDPNLWYVWFHWQLHTSQQSYVLHYSLLTVLGGKHHFPNLHMSEQKLMRNHTKSTKGEEWASSSAKGTS